MLRWTGLRPPRKPGKLATAGREPSERRATRIRFRALLSDLAGDQTVLLSTATDPPAGDRRPVEPSFEDGYLALVQSQSAAR